MTITKLVMVRHGESQWNRENRFTGWVDVDLSDQGRVEAKRAGKILKNKGFIFDRGYTSVLKRAIHTLWLIIDELDQAWLPIRKHWRLNERHYGMLQGLNKAETIKKFGNDKVQQWRRSLNVAPPKIINNENLGYDLRYMNNGLNQLPDSESLSSTINRVRLCLNYNILPNIKRGRKLVIVAHGNSIRAMIVLLNNLKDEEEIFQLNVPTATPLIYEFDDKMQIVSHYFLNLN
ncbi:2,3-diphosphoglycerate-dependent phosphoglycerate mutase [Blochmannia endosymbiont of Colobopsis nipponica]|uniref:2,3-diphosphoglycerate-dependent phosphoglycerate mutase n=1 Tax=Blochmannia endosymbiont of Colobopsis nipponica TaxID=2681987 RepID=UPI00178327D5|nr:2,3-diphosphoglycerate-dependent phosphoglycerate mutase [Blochmannia endosymbiont of Colobopsis nipponica]QOI11103.1 2,3-diphosphoglycerate-dependent phosphoglycerate mutase [Blochmannia endosymbiont of Colobopsis nipponica]